MEYIIGKNFDLRETRFQPDVKHIFLNRINSQVHQVNGFWI